MNTFEMINTTTSRGDITYAVTIFNVCENEEPYTVEFSELDQFYDVRNVTECRRKLLASGYEEIDNE